MVREATKMCKIATMDAVQLLPDFNYGFYVKIVNKQTPNYSAVRFPNFISREQTADSSQHSFDYVSNATLLCDV
jgi:hypothetical protein